jgi:hypothetical protein
MDMAFAVRPMSISTHQTKAKSIFSMLLGSSGAVSSAGSRLKLAMII